MRSQIECRPTKQSIKECVMSSAEVDPLTRKLQKVKIATQCSQRSGQTLDVTLSARAMRPGLSRSAATASEIARTNANAIVPHPAVHDRN
jgi:hypothetical protein